MLKNYGIDGARLASESTRFMSDTLGITDENMCAKLKSEIDKVRTSCIEESAIYGWGNNNYGQLA